MKISVLKIETLLAEKSMTKADLANRCGISRQNVSTLIRRGTCEPRTAGKLASGLGVEVREIIERPANKSQVEISGFGSSEKGNTKSSR